MSLAKYHTDWFNGSYQDDLHFLLKVAENNPLRLNPSDLAQLRPHLDSRNFLAIGYGYDLFQNQSTARDDLVAAGVLVLPAAEKILKGLTAPTTTAVRDQLAAELILPDETAATRLLDIAIGNRVAAFKKFMSEQGIDLPDSREKAVLFSMWYQGQNGYFGTNKKPSHLTQALIDGDRAEAWFEIRYGSSRNGQDGKGVVARRFAESEMFGLYYDESGVTAEQAKAIYRMLEIHRPKMLDYEKNFASLIPKANATYELNGTNAVGPLTSSIDPAKSVLLAELRNQYPNLANFLDDNRYLSTDIYLNPAEPSQDPNHSANLDATLYKTGSAHNRSNLLIGEGGNDCLKGDAGADVLIGGEGCDTLEGGLGEDVLVGGKGDDTYIWNTGDGNDVIFDEDGQGKLLINQTPLTLARHTQSDPQDVFKTADGLTLTLNADHSLAISSLNKDVILTINNFDRNAKTLGIELQTEQLGYNQIDLGQKVLDVLAGVGDFLIGSAHASENEIEYNPKSSNQALNGSSGDDRMIGRTDGQTDKIYGGMGNDTLYADGDIGDLSAYVNSDSGQYQPIGQPLLNYLMGGGGEDLLVGGLGADGLWGGAGADILIGGEGADQLVGDDGDSDYASDGNDEIFGGAGEDFLLGNGGNDLLFGGSGADTLIGSSGDDELFGNDGNDFLYGESSNEIDESLSYDDYLDGGAGNDILAGMNGNDELFGGEGDDQLFGDSDDSPKNLQGDDVLDGGAGNDYLRGVGGNDCLIGGAGDDQMLGETGDDYLSGGDGDDVMSGGEGDDSLLGGTGIDSIYGNSGNDFIDGGDGDDLTTFGGGLIGGEGEDTIFGGSGMDELQGGDGDDFLDGGADNDILFGQAGDDTLLAGDGGDQLQGGEGDDYLDGGAGNDLLFGEAGDDCLIGGEGDDELQGNQGNDQLSGDTGTDRLFGQDGDDTLDGGDGDDHLMGGVGDDLLQGGAGRDSYYYSLGDGIDTIDDVAELDANGNTQGNLLIFQGGVSQGDLKLSVDDSSYLLVSLADGGAIHIGGFDPQSPLSNPVISSVQFADGRVLSFPQWLSRGFDFKVSAGDNTLIGTAMADRIDGSGGNDTLMGGGGNDTYRFGIGSGNDTILDFDPTPGNVDTLSLANDVTPSQVFVTRNGDDLRLTLTSKDRVTITGWFADDAHKVERVAFSDGTAWNVATLQERLQPIYHQPRLLNALIDKTAITGKSFEEQIPKPAFIDPDPGDVLRFTATRTDGAALPEWLKFDPVNLLFSGTPGNGDVGNLSVKLTATDGDGLAASGVFNLLVVDAASGKFITGTSGNDNLVGGAGCDIIDGGPGDDSLHGGTGDDWLRGGVGDDVVWGESGNDTFFFARGDGYDRLFYNTDRPVDGVDTLLLGPGILPSEVKLYGSSMTYQFNPLDYYNLYLVVNDDPKSQIMVSEFFNSPDIAGDFRYTLSKIQFADGTVWDRKSILSRVIMDHPSLSIGEDGKVTITILTNYYGAGDNLVLGGAVNASITDNRADNLIFGNSGDNTFHLIWGGKDTLYGGPGDDTYAIGFGKEDFANIDLDSITINENTGEGTDFVDLYLPLKSYQLPQNVENLRVYRFPVYDTQQLFYKGNASDNIIEVRQAIHGGLTIDGGEGIDTIIDSGAAGNTYLVDNPADKVIVRTKISAGKNQVISTASSFTLGDRLDSLILGGDQPISGNGNDANNLLDGSQNTAGNTLSGGKGNDEYHIGTNDQVVELADEGNDTVIYMTTNQDRFRTIDYAASGLSNVENVGLNGSGYGINLIGDASNNNFFISGSTASSNNLYGGGGNDALTGAGGNDLLDGGDGDDRLEGGFGNDTLDGGFGNDILFGGAGSDIYRFGLGSGQDRIEDQGMKDGSFDVLLMGAGVTAKMLTASKEPDSLVVRIKNTSDQISIRWDEATGYGVKQLVFADGFAWDAASLLRKTYPNSLPGGAVAIVGIAEQNQILTAENTLTDADGLGVLAYQWQSLGGGNTWKDIVGATASIFSPTEAQVGKRIRVVESYTDGLGTEESVASSPTEVIANVNDAPIAVGLIDNLTAVDGEPFLWTLSSNLFMDTDKDDSLSFGLTLADGKSLPSWLHFDNENLTLSGTPTSANIGNLTLIAEATDTASAKAEIPFQLIVAPMPNRTLTGGSGDDKIAGGSGNDRLVGGTGNDTLDGNSGDDTLLGGSGADLLIGGDGNDTFALSGDGLWANGYGTLNVGSPGHAGSNQFISITGRLNSFDAMDGGSGFDSLFGTDGNDVIVLDDGYSASPIGYRPRFANIEQVQAGTGDDIVDFTSTLFSYGNVILIGDDGNDVLWSSSGNDLLEGGSGNDIIDGGWGDDISIGGEGVDNLSDKDGHNLLDGGADNDKLTGGTGNELFVGGKGDDTVTTNSGKDVILFNKGDGSDIVNASTGSDNTLSLGGGVRYGDLTFSKSGNDLVLGIGANDQISFKDWYASSAYQSVLNLQVIADAMEDFDAGGNDPLRDNKVETFDFTKLANRFDQARAADSKLAKWNLADALLDFHLGSGSDSAALGGDLAYQYGKNGSLSGIGLPTAQAVVGDQQFGQSAQGLHDPSALQAANAVKLS